MGPMKLYFDFRDLFRAPRLGLSGKKIMVFTIANVIGWAIYWLLTYLAYSVSGYSFSAMWNQYGLYPCLFGHPAPWYGWAIYFIGLIIWFFVINLACTAVARITYKQLKGDEFFSSGDAFKYVKKHWYPVVFTLISLIAIVVFFVIGAIIFALFGKIPYVGEFLFSLPYLLYFFGSVFTVYSLVVLVTAFIYTPTIVAAYEEDTMGTVFQSYSITWGQPWRVIVYNLLLLPLAAIGVVVFRYFWIAGYNMINIVFGQSWLMGTKLAHIVGWATQVVTPGAQPCITDSCCGAVPQFQNSLSCLMKLPAGTTLSGTELVSGVILAIFFFLLFASVISYAFSVFSVGETLMFVIFKKKSDDDNLLERKDEDELEEEDEDNDLDDLDSDENADLTETEDSSENESDKDQSSEDSDEQNSKD
ncbi:MAG: hypothetical protein GXO90_00360 [FCB group bacterium]|nr:hypothetical protein [FCB group bacterium]